MVGGVYIISAGVRLLLDGAGRLVLLLLHPGLEQPGPGLQEPRLLGHQLWEKWKMWIVLKCIMKYCTSSVTWAWLLIMAASCLSITLLLEAAIGPGEAAVRGGGSGTGTLRI